jgi:hypothetical protein
MCIALWSGVKQEARWLLLWSDLVMWKQVVFLRACRLGEKYNGPNFER